MKRILLIAVLMVAVLGCDASTPADQGEVMKSCAAACNIGGSKMSKWNTKDGCVCDTSHTKTQ
jgi:hypothetical protein